MKIIYVSTLCSQKVLKFIMETSTVKPGMAPQKFNRLLVEGLAAKGNECRVETLSEIPIPSLCHKKHFWNIPSEKNGNITYNYIPMINWPILKSALVLVISFFKLPSLILSKPREYKIILCDIINIPLSLSVFLISRIFKIKIVAIVTDLPSTQLGHERSGRRISKKISKLILHKYDAYVFLTEQMNQVVNRRNRPYLIMEGLVDISAKDLPEFPKNKGCNRIILYAGGLSKANGIKDLIEAFLKMKDENIRFHIYGTGEMENELPHYMNLDNRIVYYGILPNKEIVEKQLTATLLVNPRFTHEEFVKYSFPSKNIEYMVSGTPVVTTCLPGMPTEYYDYVYLFHDESVSGFKTTLTNILNLDNEVLIAKGREAKEFVLKFKNNIVQARRVLDLCKSLQQN